jgi:hypothetical protein
MDNKEESDDDDNPGWGMYLFELSTYIASFIAVYLAWIYNTNEYTILRIIYTLYAFMSGYGYLFKYAFGNRKWAAINSISKTELPTFSSVKSLSKMILSEDEN